MADAAPHERPEDGGATATDGPGPSAAAPGRRTLTIVLVVLVTAGLGLAVLLTRSAPVEVALPRSASDGACTAAGQEWPATVAGVEARETDPADRAVQAWGDPAVIARCGVPALSPTTDRCISVGGVDWVAQDLSDGTRLTTFGREPAIELLVPDAYGEAPLLLPAFADAAKALPTNGRRCS